MICLQIPIFTRISKFGTGAELFINFFYLQFWRENFPKIFLNLCRIVLPSINTLPFLDTFKVITLSTNQVWPEIEMFFNVSCNSKKKLQMRTQKKKSNPKDWVDCLPKSKIHNYLILNSTSPSEKWMGKIKTLLTDSLCIFSWTNYKERTLLLFPFKSVHA